MRFMREKFYAPRCLDQRHHPKNSKNDSHTHKCKAHSLAESMSQMVKYRHHSLSNCYPSATTSVLCRKLAPQLNNRGPVFLCSLAAVLLRLLLVGCW